MKTANLPSLRVSPELRNAAESSLYEGESLSGFIEEAIRHEIEQRRMQSIFVNKALDSRTKSKETGEYRAASEVLEELALKLNKAKE